MTTTYSVQMTDSETPAVWMSLPGVVCRPGAQDSGRVRYTVETPDAASLESALNADDDVISYETSATVSALEWDDGTDETDRGWWYSYAGTSHIVVSGDLTADSDRNEVLAEIARKLRVNTVREV